MTVAIVIIVLVVVGAVTVRVFTRSNPGASTGSPSDATRKRNAGAASAPQRETSRSTQFQIETRARADLARVVDDRAILRERSAGIARREPVAEDEIGVSRRAFINRSLVGLVGLSIAGFGTASLAFLWPTGSSGFGGKIVAGKISDIVNYIQSHAAPFYVPEARGYIVQYPERDLPAAKKVYSAVTYGGMQQGFVALYQRCPHLGCRVPWCQTSQWFECPCHGSKYNRVGEKKAGPAPRGMDRFAIITGGGQLTINTSDIELGPPIGTNTTGQQQAGPLCV